MVIAPLRFGEGRGRGPSSRRRPAAAPLVQRKACGRTRAPFLEEQTMTRRPRWLIPSSAVLAAVVLIAIPLLVPMGCNDVSPPQLQTLPKAPNPEIDNTVTPPSVEEKALAMARLEKAIRAHGG